jgi:hypothetical protein
VARRRTIPVKRKAYTRKDGTRVKATAYKMKDRGAKGRGKKVIKIKKEGALGGAGYLKQTAAGRHQDLRRSVRSSDYRTTAGRVSALRVFLKRTGTRSELAKLKADQNWLRRQYGKKK